MKSQKEIIELVQEIQKNKQKQINELNQKIKDLEDIKKTVIKQLNVCEIWLAMEERKMK